ncbi:MAG TPA: hypothetical protein H9768_02095 [Candidatus Mailhella merdavium]|nr:hypothetical protein [Candidatus Mailhella merdavium]
MKDALNAELRPDAVRRQGLSHFNEALLHEGQCLVEGEMTLNPCSPRACLFVCRTAYIGN